MTKTRSKSVMPFRGKVRIIKAPKGWRVNDAKIVDDNKFVRIMYTQRVKRRSEKDER